MPRGHLIGAFFLLLAVILAGLILTDALPNLRGPAPETSEWYWPYMLRPVERWWPALLVGAAMAGFTWWWLGQEDDRLVLPLAALVVLILALQLALLYADRPAVGAELVDRTLSKASNGYVATAGEMGNLDIALRHFPELMATFDNDHARTHPPGFIVAHWLTERALHETPRLAESLARPATFWRCTDLWVLSRSPATAASLLLWAWLPPILAASAVVPAYRLGRRWFGVVPARLAALLVGTLPALVIFVPTPDQVFAFLAIASLFLVVTGLKEMRWTKVLVAGLLVSLMTFLSLGNAAWAALLGGYAILWVLWPLGERSDAGWRQGRRWAIVALFGVSATSIWLVYWLGWGVAPWAIAQVGLSQHYELVTSLRRYDWWLGYNLLDFFVFAGPPVVIGFIWLAASGVRARDIHRTEYGRVAVLLILLLAGINLAGSTRGEVGRLWLVFMPAAAVVAGGYFGRRWSEKTVVWLIVIAQLVLAISIGLAWRPFYAVILPVLRPEMVASEPSYEMNVAFATPDGRSIGLIGFDPPQTLARGSQTLDIALDWQSDGPTLRPYTVFIQLLSPTGEIIAQEDRWPVAGQWPSTCWTAGEIIPDPYSLPLPPDVESGTYALIAGLYDAATGARLVTEEGRDYIKLFDVTVDR